LISYSIVIENILTHLHQETKMISPVTWD